MQRLALRIQKQLVRDLCNFKFDCKKKQMCNIICFNPFKLFIFLKEIKEFEGRQQIDFSQEIEKEVCILKVVCAYKELSIWYKIF